MSGAQAEVVAAVDCGTHSTRLLIMRGAETLAREVVLTRLGEGLEPSGELQPAALARVRSALTDYRALMDHHQVQRGRGVATSAARDAKNGAAFLAEASEILGVPVDLIDGEQEGALTFAGATAEFSADDGPFLIVDIGGGSTEFAYGSIECEASMSLDIGSVRLSERYIEHDPPRPEELSACVTITGAWLDDIDRELPQSHGAQTVIGVAGTIATAVAVELGISEYDRDAIHHFVLTREAAEDVFRTLATENREDRSCNPGLPAGRVDSIVGGMAILVKIMRHFDLDQLVASEADLLDGLARSLQ